MQTSELVTMLSKETVVPLGGESNQHEDVYVAGLPFDYTSSRKRQKEDLRAAILNAAARLLAADGLRGLSVRAIAADVGASTKVIYSHYGGKPGIIEALYSDGFERLGDVMGEAALGADLPSSRLHRIARAYRSFAVAEPHMYELIYGPRVRELLPSPDDREGARRLQQIVAGVFQEGQDDGLFANSDPGEQSRNYWAALHGTVSLELTTWFEPQEGEERLEKMISIVLSAQSRD